MDLCQCTHCASVRDKVYGEEVDSSDEDSSDSKDDGDVDGVSNMQCRQRPIERADRGILLCDLCPESTRVGLHHFDHGKNRDG